MQGIGCFKWPDGSHYNGSFFNDMKYGIGVFMVNDNSDTDENN